MHRHRSVVYFVRSVDSGLVKIGTTVSVKARISGIRAEIGEQVEFLGAIHGGVEVERRLHAQFAEDWAKGEWFRPSDSLRRYVAEHAEPDLDSMYTQEERDRFPIRLTVDIDPELQIELKLASIHTNRKVSRVLHEILCHAFGRADLLPPGQSAESARPDHYS